MTGTALGEAFNWINDGMALASQQRPILKVPRGKTDGTFCLPKDEAIADQQRTPVAALAHRGAGVQYTYRLGTAFSNPVMSTRWGSDPSASLNRVDPIVRIPDVIIAFRGDR